MAYGRYRNSRYRRHRHYYSRFAPRSRLNQGTIYRYKRTVDYGLIAFTTANQYAGRTFKLNDLPDYAEWTATYDEYRISGIVVRYVPMATTEEATTSAYNTGLLHSAVDYDDATAPASVDEILQYQNHKLTRFNQELRTYFKPKIAEALYTTSFVGFGARREWVDCANADVAHYGFKTVLQAANTNVLTSYRVFITYYIKFRAVR